MLAMDALFGLPRKKHAGVSQRNPLFGELFYLDQSAVDQFVQDSGNPKSVSTVSWVMCIVLHSPHVPPYCRTVMILWLGA